MPKERKTLSQFFPSSKPSQKMPKLKLNKTLLNFNLYLNAEKQIALQGCAGKEILYEWYTTGFHSQM